MRGLASSVSFNSVPFVNSISYPPRLREISTMSWPEKLVDTNFDIAAGIMAEGTADPFAALISFQSPLSRKSISAPLLRSTSYSIPRRPGSFSAFTILSPAKCLLRNV